MRYLAFCILLLFAATINADDQTSSDPIFQHMQVVGDFISQMAGLVRNEDEAALERLGPIKSRKIRPTEAPNAPPGEKWTYQTIVYPGLEIRGDVGPTGVFYPTYIGISDEHWDMPFGLKVGSSLAEVKAVLGAPDSATDSDAIYNDETETVTFHLKGTKISSVEFDIYLD